MRTDVTINKQTYRIRPELSPYGNWAVYREGAVRFYALTYPEALAWVKNDATNN